MYTTVGKIVNTHGIKGAIKVYPYTDDNSRFKLLKEVYCGEGKTIFHVNEVNFHKNMVILAFDEFDNINQVIKLKGELLYIKDEDRMPLKENRYYISDLIGLEVRNISGQTLGSLVDVYEGYANDVYYINTEKGMGAIPAVKEFIKKISIEEGYMIVDPIEGMMP
ncbi:MAG: 16S rRNA processing protein RimM [Tissierellia bacterium]|nr:16S rRNA processing protein RimM [Tissierellia bacterium]